MPTRGNTRASLFLMELIFAILFFALGSAVCVQAFARAYTVSRQAKELAFASATVSGAAEALRADAFEICFPTAYESDGGFAVAYDAEFGTCEPGQGRYFLYAARTSADGVCWAELRLAGSDGQTVYELSLHWPVKGGAV